VIFDKFLCVEEPISTYKIYHGGGTTSWTNVKRVNINLGILTVIASDNSTLAVYAPGSWRHIERTSEVDSGS
jgi:hypothetical protein